MLYTHYILVKLPLFCSIMFQYAIINVVECVYIIHAFSVTSFPRQRELGMVRKIPSGGEIVGDDLDLIKGCES